MDAADVAVACRSPGTQVFTGASAVFHILYSGLVPGSSQLALLPHAVQWAHCQAPPQLFVTYCMMALFPGS